MCRTAALLTASGLQASTGFDSDTTVERVVQRSSSLLDHLFSTEVSITAIRSYAFALQSLGTYFFLDGNAENALDLQLLAIAPCREMVSIHGHEYKVHLPIALSLSLDHLVQGGIVGCVPAKELSPGASREILCTTVSGLLICGGRTQVHWRAWIGKPKPFRRGKRLSA